MPQIQRAMTAEVTDIDPVERTVVSTINTDALDRYRTVIVPEGGRFEAYRKNPVVLLNHGGLPIGKNLWIKAQKKRIVAKTKFLPLGQDETADKVFALYEQGYLNAWSISFDPIAAGRPSPEELRKRPELANCQTMYREWDLLEYSCVTIPGNPEATREAIRRGLALPGWDAPPEPEPAPPIGDMPSLPPLHGRTVAQVKAAMVAEIRSTFGDPKAIARDILDLAKGRV